jgi:hypothetical protein
MWYRANILIHSVVIPKHQWQILGNCESCESPVTLWSLEPQQGCKTPANNGEGYYRYTTSAYCSKKCGHSDIAVTAAFHRVVRNTYLLSSTSEAHKFSAQSDYLSAIRYRVDPLIPLLHKFAPSYAEASENTFSNATKDCS